MGTLDVSSDALGRALLDHLADMNGPPLLLESDHGTLREADFQPADFFSSPDTWPAWERQAVDHATGTVFDLGAGAGRHSLYLQELGFRVTAIDASPGCVEVCRSRGIHDVRLMDLQDLSGHERWDTVLLMGGNLGVAGDWEQSRRLLISAAATGPSGAVGEEHRRRMHADRSVEPTRLSVVDPYISVPYETRRALGIIRYPDASSARR